MEPKETIAQPEPRLIQVQVTETAYLRLKMEAARQKRSMGAVISDLTANLPAVEEAA